MSIISMIIDWSAIMGYSCLTFHKTVIMGHGAANFLMVNKSYATRGLHMDQFSKHDGYICKHENKPCPLKEDICILWWPPVGLMPKATVANFGGMPRSKSPYFCRFQKNRRSTRINFLPRLKTNATVSHLSNWNLFFF